MDTRTNYGMSGYTKLFSSILMSSIWEESAETRLVWVTLLALADQNGHVDGTVKSLARVSRVPIKACQEALDCLLGPDEYDRSGVMDGERLILEPGGWRLVNHAAYRAKMSVDERRLRDKIRKREARVSARRPQTSEIVRDVLQAEAEAKAEQSTNNTAEARRSSPTVWKRAVAIAHKSIEAYPSSLPDQADAFKATCAKQGIDYGAIGGTDARPLYARALDYVASVKARRVAL